MMAQSSRQGSCWMHSLIRSFSLVLCLLISWRACLVGAERGEGAATGTSKAPLHSADWKVSVNDKARQFVNERSEEASSLIEAYFDAARTRINAMSDPGGLLDMRPQQRQVSTIDSNIRPMVQDTMGDRRDLLGMNPKTQVSTIDREDTRPMVRDRDTMGDSGLLSRNPNSISTLDSQNITALHRGEVSTLDSQTNRPLHTGQVSVLDRELTPLDRTLQANSNLGSISSQDSIGLRGGSLGSMSSLGSMGSMDSMRQVGNGRGMDSMVLSSQSSVGQLSGNVVGRGPPNAQQILANLGNRSEDDEEQDRLANHLANKQHYLGDHPDLDGHRDFIAEEEAMLAGPMGLEPAYPEMSPEQQAEYEKVIGTADENKFPKEREVHEEITASRESDIQKARQLGEEHYQWHKYDDPRNLDKMNHKEWTIGRRIPMINKMLNGLEPAIAKPRMLEGTETSVVGLAAELDQLAKKSRNVLGDLKGSKKYADLILGHFDYAHAKARSDDNFAEKAEERTIRKLQREVNNMQGFPPPATDEEGRPIPGRYNDWKVPPWLDPPDSAYER